MCVIFLGSLSEELGKRVIGKYHTKKLLCGVIFVENDIFSIIFWLANYIFLLFYDEDKKFWTVLLLCRLTENTIFFLDLFSEFWYLA